MSYRHDLSDEEKHLVYSMHENSFLGNASFSLKKIWRERELELEAEKLQPYADLLYFLILSELDKTSILASLNQKATSAKHKTELHVPIWSYKSVSWQKPGSGRPSEKVREDGLDWTLSVKRPSDKDADCDYEYVLAPERIDRIMKKTDILLRLTAAFGPSFWLTCAYSSNSEKSTEFYYAYTVTLHLHFFPNGLPLYRLKHVLATRKKYETHETTPIQDDAVLCLWKGEEKPAFTQQEGSRLHRHLNGPRSVPDKINAEGDCECEDCATALMQLRRSCWIACNPGLDYPEDEEDEDERNPYAKDPMCACEWCD